MENAPFRLDKFIWTESDFAEMGWMDAQIWSMYADDSKSEYVLDIDYIFKWEEPAPEEVYFKKWWVSTATMVFENVDGIRIQMNSPEGAMGVESFRMEPSSHNPRLRQFRFECGQGELSIQASGYKMYVRRRPTLHQEQYFSYDERGGIGFGRELERP